jgi:iron complex outermembrane receptor protein
MRIGFISGMLGGLCLTSTLHAQEPDSLKAVSLSEVVVTESYRHRWMSVRAFLSR